MHQALCFIYLVLRTIGERVRKTNPAVNFIITAVLMMALWFIMSGKTETKFLILGAGSSILVAAICLRTLTMKGRDPADRYYLLSVNPIRFLIYFIWLLWQIVKSAIYVSGLVLKGIRADEPSIAWFRADYDNPAARALLANSITLTPGTITVDITPDGIYSVHALNDELKEGLLDGSMQGKVAWVYGESINFGPVDPEEAQKELAGAASNSAEKISVRRRNA